MLTFKRNYLTRSLPIVVISEPKQSGGREIPNSSPTLAILPNLKKKGNLGNICELPCPGSLAQEKERQEKKKNN